MTRSHLLFLGLGVAAVILPLDGASDQTAGSKAPLQTGVPLPQGDRPAVDVMFVLDTTGSMGGLIQAAKEKIWAVVNTLAAAEATPRIRVGLVSFRDRGDEHVTSLTDLTGDLDAVFRSLVKFRAAGGGDSPESVNEALYEAVWNADWNKDPRTLRVVYLVGDSPPHMDYADDVKFTETCPYARELDVIINTIQCGRNSSTTPYWERIAELGGGRFIRVEQDGGAILVETQYDFELVEFARRVDDTRVFFGRVARIKAQFDRQDTRRVLSEASASMCARRAEFLAMSAADEALFGDTDLVGAVGDGKIDLRSLADAEVPDEMREMSVDQREAYISALATTRRHLRQRIQKLSEQRQSHIRGLIDSGAILNADRSFNHAVYDSVQQQGARKGIQSKGRFE